MKNTDKSLTEIKRNTFKRQGVMSQEAKIVSLGAVDPKKRQKQAEKRALIEHYKRLVLKSFEKTKVKHGIPKKG